MPAWESSFVVVWSDGMPSSLIEIRESVPAAFSSPHKHSAEFQIDIAAVEPDHLTGTQTGR